MLSVTPSQASGLPQLPGVQRCWRLLHPACQRQLSLHCEEGFKLNSVSRSSSFLSQVKNSLNAPTECSRVGLSHLSPQILHKKEDNSAKEPVFQLKPLSPAQQTRLRLFSFSDLFLPVLCISQSTHPARWGCKEEISPQQPAVLLQRDLPAFPSTIQPHLEDSVSVLIFVQFSHQWKILGVFKAAMCFLSNK